MKPAHRSQRGFTLLEVLISLLILLIGLLGIAALMLKGQRASFEAYQRQQALAMAQEMAEKIRANQGAAASYVTGTGAGALATRIAALTCIATDSSCVLAKDDLTRWDRTLAGASETKDGTRVGGIIGARGCIERPDAGQPVFWVSVAWQGEADTGAPAATASACGSGSYGTAARRRLVTLSVGTCPLAGGGGCT